MIRHGQAPYLECSSRGERRLSAMFASPSSLNGKTIEEAYQSAKVFTGVPFGTLSWREAKGRRASNQKECAAIYARLWDEYIAENHFLLDMICSATGLSDMFGAPGSVCQATELWRIRNKYLAFSRTRPLF